MIVLEKSIVNAYRESRIIVTGSDCVSLLGLNIFDAWSRGIVVGVPRLSRNHRPSRAILPDGMLAPTFHTRPDAKEVGQR